MNKFFQILLFIISAWLLPFIILAQAPEIEWQRTPRGTVAEAAPKRVLRRARVGEQPAARDLPEA